MYLTSIPTAQNTTAHKTGGDSDVMSFV
jgi:hypothetical protein